MTQPPRRQHVSPLTLLGLLLLPLALGVQWASTRCPDTVEAVYSRGVFPAVVTTLAWLSSRLPFSVAEFALAGGVVLLTLAVAWTIRAVVRGRGRRWQILGRTLVLAAACAGAGYALFLICWGMNYQRASFAQSAGLRVGLSDRTELAALSAFLIDTANDLRATLAEDEHGVMQLADGPRATLDRTVVGAAVLLSRYPWLPRLTVRPKPVLTSFVLARLGVAGFYSPFTAEAIVDIAMPAPEVPMAAAHETAHLLGFAREDEANYLGYLMCRLHPDADFNYSGTLAASRYVQRALSSVDRATARALESQRSPAVRRDGAAIARWVARHTGPAMHAFARANDAYLRTQGQRDGTQSYGRMVDLLLAEWRAEHARPQR